MFFSVLSVTLWLWPVPVPDLSVTGNCRVNDDVPLSVRMDDRFELRVAQEGFIYKPCDPEHVVRTIRRILGLGKRKRARATEGATTS